MALRIPWKEIGVPVAGFVFFFFVEAAADIGELPLTVLLMAATLLMFRVRYHANEWTLFGLGTVLGAFIEIGLRVMGYQQVWADTTLAGVPVWLPLSWGFGAVVFTRIGYHVRHLSRKTRR